MDEAAGAPPECPHRCRLRTRLSRGRRGLDGEAEPFEDEEDEEEERRRRRRRRNQEALQKGGVGTPKASIGGGIAMMVGAVVWFCDGLAFDRIFFYPPILFVFGIVAVVKGDEPGMKSSWDHGFFADAGETPWRR